MGLNGPDEWRTQKLPGSHGYSDFEKASGFRKNNASGVQRYFEAANGQIFFPDLPASSTKILGKLAATRTKAARR
jgi:hypothetical protein